MVLKIKKLLGRREDEEGLISVRFVVGFAIMMVAIGLIAAIPATAADNPTTGQIVTTTVTNDGIGTVGQTALTVAQQTLADEYQRQLTSTTTATATTRTGFRRTGSNFNTTTEPTLNGTTASTFGQQRPEEEGRQTTTGLGPNRTGNKISALNIVTGPRRIIAI